MLLSLPIYKLQMLGLSEIETQLQDNLIKSKVIPLHYKIKGIREMLINRILDWDCKLRYK